MVFSEIYSGICDVAQRPGDAILASSTKILAMVNKRISDLCKTYPYWFLRVDPTTLCAPSVVGAPVIRSSTHRVGSAGDVVTLNCQYLNPVLLSNTLRIGYTAVPIASMTYVAGGDWILTFVVPVAEPYGPITITTAIGVSNKNFMFSPLSTIGEDPRVGYYPTNKGWIDRGWFQLNGYYPEIPILVNDIDYAAAAPVFSGWPVQKINWIKRFDEQGGYISDLRIVTAGEFFECLNLSQDSFEEPQMAAFVERDTGCFLRFHPVPNINYNFYAVSLFKRNVNVLTATSPGDSNFVTENFPTLVINGGLAEFFATLGEESSQKKYEDLWEKGIARIRRDIFDQETHDSTDALFVGSK